MNPAVTAAHDFQGLARLRADAARESPEATREAARQFEALFVQMMLKSMRSAGAVLGEQRDTTYEDMFDQQVAMEMTRERGLGLADMLVRQLGGAGGPDWQPQTIGRALPVTAAPASSVTPRQDWRPEDRQQFVQAVWPLAERAAARLDVDPRALVAQAALETGWGSRLIRDGDGVSANNLFGIKADGRWDGERVGVLTLEYEGGLPRPQRAQFRAYPDLPTAFEDYVNFLEANPRYRAALDHGGNTHDFLRGLQEAGYATDPRYAEKIDNILNGPALREALPDTGASLPRVATLNPGAG